MEKDDFICWTRRLYNRGLSPATSGNVSMLADDNNILITASGCASGDIWIDDIVKINFDGELIEGDKKPSSEKFLHIEIYKKRPDIRAIIHSHSPEIAAFAVAGKKIDDIILPDMAFYFGDVPLAKYYTPGKMELAHEVSDYFVSRNAVLMKNHGIVVGGKNLKEAFYALESIQAYCKTYLYATMLKNLCTISKKDIKEIQALRK